MAGGDVEKAELVGAGGVVGDRGLDRVAGINWDATLDLTRAVSIPVIASGGLASMADIAMMTRPEMQILEGAISGRALYDGRIDSREALRMLKRKSLA